MRQVSSSIFNFGIGPHLVDEPMDALLQCFPAHSLVGLTEQEEAWEPSAVTHRIEWWELSEIKRRGSGPE